MLRKWKIKEKECIYISFSKKKHDCLACRGKLCYAQLVEKLSECPFYLYLIFEKSSLKNGVGWTWFFFLVWTWVLRPKQYFTVVPEPGGPGGPLAPPIFCRSVNPIRTGEGRLSPPITAGPPDVFHLPASLYWYWSRDNWYLYALRKILYHHSPDHCQSSYLLDKCK